MNKIKATKKEMRENYFIIGISYCLAQNLLHYERPIAYSSGVYGWACDYYLVNGVVISTGYSPLSSKNAVASYQMIKDYDKKAEIIRINGSNYDQTKEAINTLLCEFVEQAKKNARKGE
jgi:hypothetical protein